MKPGISIQLPQSEVDRFKAWTRNLDAHTKAKVKTAVVDCLSSVERGSKMLAPVSKDTRKNRKVGGRLRASVHPRYSPEHLGGDVTVNAKYAPYQEFGTGGLVRVLPGYEDYAMQFKGMGIRQVNIHPQPFFFEVWEDQKKKLIKELKELGFK